MYNFFIIIYVIQYKCVLLRSLLKKICFCFYENESKVVYYNDINFIEIKTPPSNLSSELLKINIKIYSLQRVYLF